MNLRPSLLLGAVLLLVFASCRPNAPSAAADEEERDTASFRAVDVFLEGQLHKMESPGTHLTVYTAHNGKSDSNTIKATEARGMIAPFLTVGKQGDSIHYSRSVIQDSTHHQTIVSYEAVNDSDALNRVDVFTDAGSGVIRQLYLQYITHTPDSSTRLQLIWKTDHDFTLISTIDKDQYTADLRKQKVIWGRP